jgi:hypothetical protein
MKRTVTADTALVIARTTALGLVGTEATADGSRLDAHFYTTKTPNNPQESLREHQSAPRGFAPIFTENVARHGSRETTDSSDGDTVPTVLGAGRRTGRGKRAVGTSTPNRRAAGTKAPNASC